MTASLYQSGSPTASLPIAGMPVTFAAQIAPRNHRVFGRRVAVGQRKKTAAATLNDRCRQNARAGGAQNNYRYGNFIIWLATHCHRPLRSTQVSVKRNFRSNGLASLSVPFSCAVPTTTATFGP